MVVIGFSCRQSVSEASIFATAREYDDSVSGSDGGGGRGKIHLRLRVYLEHESKYDGSTRS